MARAKAKKVVAKKTVRKSASKTIKVMIGELVKPLVIKECAAGMLLGAFLQDNGITMDNNVRVNGDTKTASYKLHNNDVITIIGSVSGGY